MTISPTFEMLRGVSRFTNACGELTTHAYPALRGGWAALCEGHAATPLADLLAQGETLEVAS